MVNYAKDKNETFRCLISDRKRFILDLRGSGGGSGGGRGFFLYKRVRGCADTYNIVFIHLVYILLKI